MIKHTNPIFWLILWGICAHLSCNLVNVDRPNRAVSSGTTEVGPPLTDTVSIEIFILRLAPHQNELVQQLWQEVDEQSLPPQLRRELFAQGLRAGILGNLLSPALAQLLNVSADGRTDVPWGEVHEVSVRDIAREPAATRNVRNLLPDMRALVKVFDTPLPEQSLFWEENGMIHGQTYTEAVGLLCISATANRDGSALIQIVPELEYGVSELRLRPMVGLVVQETSRPRHVFESLTVSQRLLPGQWLIIGCTTPDAPGAGRAFFVRRGSVLEQRLLAVRLLSATSAAVPTPAPSTMSARTDTTIPERD